MKLNLKEAIALRDQHANLIGKTYDGTKIDDIAIVPLQKENYDAFLKLYFDNNDWKVIFNLPQDDYELIVFTDLDSFESDGILMFDRLERVLTFFK